MFGGKRGSEYYNKLGYVPYDVGVNENAARTWNMLMLILPLVKWQKSWGKDEELRHYLKQSMNYKNVFDPSTRLMRGKNEDGNFQNPFNPLKWGDAFTEGNSLHYTWSVFHDVQGLD